jgi:metallo-beta-lactamase class B
LIRGDMNNQKHPGSLKVPLSISILANKNFVMIKRSIQLALIISTLISIRSEAQKINEPQNVSAQWSQPYQPFRIVGNVYYVGTYDLACYLITTSEGNILINSGLAASAPIIIKNIEDLGFNAADTKILLTTQAHYDHVGAFADLQKLTGAKMLANSKDAEVLADGGSSDYELAKKYGRTFEPVHVDGKLKDGDLIKLGTTQLTMLHHPGHTKGSSSFLLDVKDENKTYKVLIANMPTIVTDRKFSDIPEYPEIAKDFEFSFKALKKQSFDLWLSSHAGQFSMHSKHKPGDAYNPEAFADRRGYDKSLAELEVQYLKKIQEK